MEEEVAKELPCSDHRDAVSQLKDKPEEESSVREGQHCMDQVKADATGKPFAKELVVPNNLMNIEGENPSSQVCQDSIPPLKSKEGKKPSSVDWHLYMNQVKIEIEEEPSTEEQQHSMDLVKIAVQKEPFANTHQGSIDIAKSVPRDKSHGSSIELEKIEEGEKSAQVRPGSIPLLKGNKGPELSPVHSQGHMVKVKIKEEEAPLPGDHQHSTDWVKIKVGDEPFSKNHQGFGGLDSAEGEDSSSRSCWGSVHSVKIEEGEHEDYYPSVSWEEGKEQPMTGWTDSVNQVNIEGQLASDKQHPELIKWVTFKDQTKSGLLSRNAQGGRRIRSSVDGLLVKTDSALTWQTTPVVRVASQAMQYANAATSTHPRRLKRSAKKISIAAKARKARFTEEATNVLVDLVLPRYNKLFGDQSRRVPLQQKKLIWQGIADRVNSVSTIKRTWRETKKRWYDIKKRIREKYQEAKRHVKGMDEEDCVKLELSPAESKVLKMMDRASLEGLGGIDTLIDQPKDIDRLAKVAVDKHLEVIDVSDDPLLQQDVPIEETQEEAEMSYPPVPVVALNDVPDPEVEKETGLQLKDCTGNIVGPNSLVGSLPNVLNVEQEIKILPEVAPQPKSTFRMRRSCNNAVVEPSDFAQKALDDQSKLLECSQQQSKAVSQICSHVQKYIRVVKKNEGSRHADAITVSGDLVRVANALENVAVALVKSQESHVALMEKIAAQNEIMCKTQLQNNLMLKSLMHMSGKRWSPEKQVIDVPSPVVKAYSSETVLAPSTAQFSTDDPSTSSSNGPLPEMGRKGRKRSAPENVVLGKIKNIGGYGIRRKKRNYIQRRRRNATGEQGYSPKMISLKMHDSYQSAGPFSEGEWNNSKVRKARYSEEATMVLVELVIKNHSILLGEEAKITTTERKREVWAMIAEKVNAISKTKRTWEEARKRWYDVKKSVREKYLKARREAKSTDSTGAIKVELTAPEVRVVEYMDLAKLQGLRIVDTSDRVHGEVQEHSVPAEDDDLAADLYNGGSQALPFLHDMEVAKEVVEAEKAHALEDLPVPGTNGGVEFFPNQSEEDVVMLEVHNGHRNLISKTGMMGTLLSEDQDYSGGLCDPHPNPFKKPKILAVPQQFPPSVAAMSPAAKFALEEAELINCSERQAESLQNIATLLQLNLERGAVMEKQHRSDLSDIVGALKSVTAALNRNADVTADLVRQMGAQHVVTMEMVAGCSRSIQTLADAIAGQRFSAPPANSNTVPIMLDASTSSEPSSRLQSGVPSPSKRPTLRPVQSLMPNSQS